MDVANYWFSSVAAGGIEITNSLRFRGAQTLTWTPSSTPVDQNRQTLSFWVKRGGLGTSGGGILDARTSSTGYADLVFSGNSTVDSLRHMRVISGSPVGNVMTLALYRDPSAWYHVVFIYDSNNATAADRIRWYVNGEFVAHDSNNNLGLGIGSSFGKDATPMRFGYDQQLNLYLEGYLAEVHFLDGTVVTDASDFGEFNGDGVWVPKEVSGVTYGTNGFYLDFSDPADIGADRSGNGNNFTPTGFDTSIDVNSEDYRNPILLHARTQTYQGTTKTFAFNEMTFGAVYSSSRKEGMNALTTLELPKSGKWYIPMQDQYNGYSGSVYRASGLWLCKKSDQTTFSWNPTTSGNSPDDRPFIGRGKNYTWGNTNRSFVQGNVPGILMSNSNPTSRELANDNGTPNYTPVVYFLDCDAGEGYVAVAVGGSISFTTGTGLSDTAHMTWDVNEDYLIGFWLMGMDNAVGNRTFRLAADSADLIDTATVPAGYEFLSMPNLPNVSITNPSDHFTTILDTGANILTNAQSTFSNGLWWIKDRDNSNDHQLVDSTRGGNVITCPQIALPTAYATPAGNSVAWCWNAPTSYSNPTSNTTGYINVNAGFAILNADISVGTFTVPHGLSAAPEFLIAVGTSNSATQRNVWHKSIAASEALYLNSDVAKFSAPNLWASTAPTSTEITLGSDWAASGATTVAIYAWHSVPGYSAFGTYTGDGTADGPSIYTGFRPAFVIIKAIAGTRNWWANDSQRMPYNSDSWDNGLEPNTTVAEGGGLGAEAFDLLSNGFKSRSTNGSFNASAVIYVYAAFAEHPFGGGNVSPSPAR